MVMIYTIYTGLFLVSWRCGVGFSKPTPQRHFEFLFIIYHDYPKNPCSIRRHSFHELGQIGFRY